MICSLARKILPSFNSYGHIKTLMAELKPSAFSTRAVASLVSCFSCAKNPKFQPPLAAAVNPLASSCNSRVHSLIKAGDPAAAISVYKDFIRAGIPPLYPTLTSLLYCFSLTKNPKLSFSTACLILKSGHPVGTHVLNLLIKALCQSRQLDEAIEVFQQFPRQRIPPDVITYNILIHGLIKEKRMERAMELWKDMDERDLQPNLLWRGSMFSRALSLSKSVMRQQIWKMILHYIDRK